jgi:monomeric sarcosine oxidase
MAHGSASEGPHEAVNVPPSGTLFDLIVIGGGTVGLSAAYYATARGLSTLLLEQFGGLANRWASSCGASRMFRIMYSPGYMAHFAEASLAMWQEIEVASGVQILQTQPLLFYGDPGNTVEGNLAEMRRILQSLGVPFMWYPDPGSLKHSFPAFKAIPIEYSGLAQPNSAVIRAEKSIAAFAKLAAGAGATLLFDQVATVTAIPETGPYQVSCAAGNYLSKHLVLCPSAWTNSVLKPFGLQINLTIWQMTVAYFKADVARYAYPLWYEFGPDSSSLYYGFPADEIPGFLKVSADFTNAKFSDPKDCTYQPDPAILSKLGAFLRQRFNDIDPTATHPSTCLYTMSSDGQVVLDRLGPHNISIFTCDSGRGFKFTPVFGRILVDLAVTGKTYYDIRPFSIKRPGIIRN